jgi:hypothetical protein
MDNQKKIQDCKETIEVYKKEIWKLDGMVGDIKNILSYLGECEFIEYWQYDDCVVTTRCLGFVESFLINMIEDRKTDIESENEFIKKLSE